MRPIKQWMAAALVATVALGMAIATADAQTKKVIRINHAGADDILGTEHQMFSWIFANYVNQKAPTLDVKLFPNSGLGQSRQVIEAMQLGSGASMHIGGMAEFANFCQARCGVIGLPFIFKGYDHVQRVLDGPVGAALSAELEKVRLQGARLPLFLGLPQRRDRQEGDQDRRRPQGPEDQDHPDAGFRRRHQRDGRFRDADEFRRGLYLDAERRAGRLRAHRLDDVVVQVPRDREICGDHPAPDRSDGGRILQAANGSKLDAKEQAVVMEGAKLAIDIARAMSSVREAESLAQLKKLGMTITHPDMTEARAKAADVQKEMAAKLKAEDLLQQILAQ